MARQRLGEILVAAGVVRQDQVDIALRDQQRWGGQVGQILISKRFISEEILVKALSQQLKIDVVDLEGMKISPDVIALVPEEMAYENTIIPFLREVSILHVAMGNPLNLGITDELRIRTKLHVQAHLAGPGAIQAAIRAHYGHSRAAIALETEAEAEAAAAEAPTETESAEVRRLQERVARLEALVARDEDVLRKLLGLLIDKGIATREEILAAIG